MENFTIYEQLLDLPDLKVTGVEIESKKIIVSCQIVTLTSKCPNCGRISDTINQYYTRQVRDLNMGERYVYLKLKVRQFYCKHCHRHYTESLEFADFNAGYTHRQKQFIFCIAQKQSYKETAALVDVSAKTVERIILSTGEQVLSLPDRYVGVRRLGIDEHSHRKGKKDYLCLITDLDRGIIIDILPDRKKETLIAHFHGLGADFCNQISDISCDLWDGFISVAQICFPHASLVLDRYHVTKLLNNCIDYFRKKLRKEDPENPHYKKLKWLLYKQYHTLSDEQLDNLDLAFEQSPLLQSIYHYRDRFHQVLDNTTSVQQALTGIEQWIEEVKQKGITVFDKFIKTLTANKIYIANYVVNNVSNAATEGLNNLIRSIRRFSFGMPNFHHLKLRLFALYT